MRAPVLIVPLAALVALSACEDAGTAAATPAAAKKKKDEVVAAPVALATAISYAYNPTGKRDPFRSPIQDAQRIEQTEGPCTEPLCQWDLDQLQLVAVVTGDANPFAMVEDPHGRGYIVRRNTKMGKQGGKVTQILRDSVTVTEYWTAPDGTQKPNPLSLSLRADPTRLPDVDINTGRQY